MASSLLLIGCVTLMLFAVHVQGLKCVVCGPGNYHPVDITKTCPANLPEPVDCKEAARAAGVPGVDWIDYKFCYKGLPKGDPSLITRACSTIESNKCESTGCEYTCNTDGCNGSNISSVNGNLLTMLMCVAFIVLVGFKRA